MKIVKVMLSGLLITKWVLVRINIKLWWKTVETWWRNQLLTKLEKGRTLIVARKYNINKEKFVVHFIWPYRSQGDPYAILSKTHQRLNLKFDSRIPEDKEVEASILQTYHIPKETNDSFFSRFKKTLTCVTK